MYILFLFWQIYNTICVVPVSSSYDKVSQYVFKKKKIQVVIIYSLKKENHEGLSKESEMPRTILQYCRGSDLLCCVQ